MCFGWSKEPSHWDGSFDYPQHMFWLRNKKIIFKYTHNFPIFQPMLMMRAWLHHLPPLHAFIMKNFGLWCKAGHLSDVKGWNTSNIETGSPSTPYTISSDPWVRMATSRESMCWRASSLDRYSRVIRISCKIQKNLENLNFDFWKYSLIQNKFGTLWIFKKKDQFKIYFNNCQFKICLGV